MSSIEILKDRMFFSQKMQKSNWVSFLECVLETCLLEFKIFILTQKELSVTEVQCVCQVSLMVCLQGVCNVERVKIAKYPARLSLTV